jgi:hypothetical protein
MAKAKRVNNAEWKASQPKVRSTANMRAWGKANPNYKANASKAEVETRKEPTTMTRANTPAREKQVKKWQAARPVSGKGKSKSDSEKAERRAKMVDWAKWNPTRASNARRARKK